MNCWTLTLPSSAAVRPDLQGGCGVFGDAGGAHGCHAHPRPLCPPIGPPAASQTTPGASSRFQRHDSCSLPGLPNLASELVLTFSPHKPPASGSAMSAAMICCHEEGNQQQHTHSLFTCKLYLAACLLLARTCASPASGLTLASREAC